ncbi:uncharacterized protein LOC127728075 [Mytilus californianus]|uniref:uncharacterized protein LOC127728075 n=1 Tax=Mytilus californianus TaxID=6549 RepID=UPI0022473394|nr:uncharacterized protein LOC127728075 [Mytilus californianus]
MEGREVKTLVFFDLETTGFTKPRITELSMMSVQREDLLTTVGTPRVVNKVTLCVNPQRYMEPEASRITGLYNDNLEDQTPFDSSVTDTIHNFLNRLPSPVCLLAHNGNTYDYPLLLKELLRCGKILSPELLCADSLIAFKDLDGYVHPGEKPKSSDGSSSQPTSRVTTPLDSLLQTTDLSQSLNLNRKTPLGQPIPETTCSNMKEKVRQLKRKCDASFDRGPIEAKAVRKRLFQSDPIDIASLNKEVKSESGNRNFAGSKPSTLEKLVSAKRFKPEVETVKKRLNFDSDDDDDSTDSSLNCSTDYEMLERNSAINGHAIEEKSNFTCDFNKNLKQGPTSYFSNLDSQGSLKDEDLVNAIEQVENKVPTFGMDGLESPTHCQNFIDVPTTSNAICVTPKKGEIIHVDIQTTNETTPVKNTLPVKSELKYTPVTQLARFTEKVQLNTPKSSRMNEQLKQLSAGPSASVGNHPSSFSAFVTASYSNTTTVNSSAFGVQKRVSYSLTNIYKRTFGCEPAISHTAEDDCKALLQCVKRKSPDFIRWVDRNSILLSNLQPMS